MNRTNVFMLLLLIFTIFIAPEYLFSQRTSKQDLIDLIKTADAQMGRKTGALIILKQYNMTINEKRKDKGTLRIVGKIYDNQALSDYSHIPIGYNSFYEEVSLDFARVIRNDGSILEVNKDAVQIKTSPDFSEDTRYSDSKFLTFALPGLEIGAAFEYQVRFNQKNSIIEGEWFDHYFFGSMLLKLSPPFIPRIDPVQKSVINICLPKDLPIKYNLTSSQALPVKSSNKNLDIYTWTLTDVPGLAFESAMPAISSLTPILSVTTLKDWSQIDKWAREKLFSGTEITEAIMAVAKETAGNAESREEKIRQILSYIHNNIRYTYADLSRGGFTPHPLSEIINSRYGDCKDQSILFISLLKCLGIEALPVLVNPYPQEEILEVPAPFFEHLIAVVPGENDSIWLDLTSKFTPFPELAFADMKRKAFVINGKGGKLTSTPQFNSDSPVSVFEHKVFFNGRDAINSLSIDAAGVVSESLKSSFLSTSTGNSKEYFWKTISDHLNDAKFDSINFPGITEMENRFKSRVYFHFDSVWNKDEGMVSFGSFAAIPLAVFTGFDSKFLPEKRENDIIPPYPNKIRGTETYFPPESDMLPVTIPPDDSLKNEFFFYKRTFAKSKLSTKVDWELTIPATTVPAGKYMEYVSTIKKIEELSSWTITYADPMKFVLKMLNENPFSLINECNDILKNDDENTFALLLKGYSYNRVQRPDSAINSFAKVLSFDPENKYAHFWIALTLFQKRLNSEANKHLEEVIKIDPTFLEAYLVLGSSYERQNQVEKASVTFHKATDSNPESPLAWKTLAIFAIHNGKHKESIDHLKNAIRLDTADVMLYSMLGESYLKMKSYNNAVDAYKIALRKNPGKGTIYGNLAWTYYLLNDDNKCIEYSKKALSIDPTLYYARFNIALAHLRSGNIVEAFRLYEELRKLRYQIPSENIIGAIHDLDDLMSKGIRVHETNNIIESFNENKSIFK